MGQPTGRGDINALRLAGRPKTQDDANASLSFAAGDAMAGLDEETDLLDDGVSGRIDGSGGGAIGYGSACRWIGHDGQIWLMSS